MPHSVVETSPVFDENPSTNEHFRAVQALLSEVAQGENTPAAHLTQSPQLAKAFVAWLVAFDHFKRFERIIGLPVSPDNRLGYGAIVAQLKGAGKWLLIAAGQNPRVLESLGIHHDDLVARVRELSWDDDWAENPLSPKERDRLSAAFGG